jgi:hypothetical protein
MGKGRKKLFKGMKAITEALELLGDDLTKRIQNSETQTFAMLDGRLARDLRYLLAGQSELIARVESLEKAQQTLLRILPEADEAQDLRRRVRALERALRDHLECHGEGACADPVSGGRSDPPRRGEAAPPEPNAALPASPGHAADTGRTCPVRFERDGQPAFENSIRFERGTAGH